VWSDRGNREREFASPTLHENLRVELMAAPAQKQAASFRDPAGFVFLQDGLFKRAITAHGRRDYDLLMNSGLYESLVAERLLLPHIEERLDSVPIEGVEQVIVPEQLPFVSYPYEWCFSQLKDAALLTLRIQKQALERGLSLKDASLFNVQFRGAEPVFIDTLSFEEIPSAPWVAYQQFCEHFLAPLLLMAHVAPDFNRYLATSLDGFDLSFAETLLPWRVRWQPGVLMHVGLHARSQRKHAGVETGTAGAELIMSPQRKLAIVESLASTVKRIRLRAGRSEWSDYYSSSEHYSAAAEESKREEVQRAVAEVEPRLVFDVGGNIGTYSRIATAKGIDCVCCDRDPLCVEQNYRSSHERGDSHMLPLVMDLTNPSPALGFDSTERAGLMERGPADLVLALALIHHLRITGNVPLARLAPFFARLGKHLLVEFIPKEDPMVQRLLSNRADIFDDYEPTNFECCFKAHFRLMRRAPLAESGRALYLFARR
jgi:hypothetical protein